MSQQHESQDALNDYLDSLVGAQSTTSRTAGLDPGLRAGVDALFDLARRADMLKEERTAMNATSTTVPPPSRGAPSFANVPAWSVGTGRTFNTWLSASIVFLMLFGIVGGAWWFGPGQGDEEPLRLAALTDDESTPVAIWPEPLSPEEAPWIAAISPEECTAEPLPYSDYAAAKTTDPGPPDGSYEIVGTPDPEDARNVVTVLRGWLACADMGQMTRVRAFYTDEYFYFADDNIDKTPYQDEVEQWRADAQREWTAWARDTGLHPISVVEGIEPPEEAMEIFENARAVLDGEETYSPSSMTISYMEARYEPADAVLLADGRIMIPTRYVYWVEDPWGQEHGFGVENNMQTAAIVLERVDGQWKIDESLIWICFGECSTALPGSLTATPIATPSD